MTGAPVRETVARSEKGFLNTLIGSLSAIALLPVATACLIYSWNSNQVAIADFLLAAGILVSGNFLLFLLLRFLLKSSELAGLVSSCLFIALFLGSYFVSALMPLWTVVWLGVAVLVVRRQDVRQTVRSLGICIGFAILALAAFNIFSALDWQGKGDAHAGSKAAFAELPPAGSQGKLNRDIYYIVLDRYARADQLLAKYNHDNSGFLRALNDRGFDVAGQAYSNYHRTAHSLASSLNMDYLDKISQDEEIVSGAFQPVYGLIETSSVARFLKREGFAFEFYGSWWEPTRSNGLADRVVNFRALPEMLRLIINNSFPGYLADLVDAFPLNTRHMQCMRARKKFEALANSPGRTNGDNPRFIFAHFLERVREAEGEAPIIILQADEGPWPKQYAGDEIHKLGMDVSQVDWLSASAEQLREKMGILNALYLPGLEGRHVYPELSPVNNFRIVLREYFGAPLPALHDKAHVYSSNADIYRFHEVSKKLSER